MNPTAPLGRFVGASLIGLLLGGCDGGTPPDLFRIQGVVIGTIRTSSGAPVSGALVSGTAAYPLVSQPMDISDTTETGTSGDYTLLFTSGNLADADAPVSLRITPPPGSGLDPKDTTGFTVRIVGTEPPPDTTRVDVTLGSSYQSTPEHLVGEFSGRAGTDFQTYDLFLAVDQVSDSVRGLWSLAFQTTCFTLDGPFSGTLEGNQLQLRLQPDEGYEATLDLTARVLPGDSLLDARLTLVQLGANPICFEDYAPITLHYGEVDGLPIGR